MSEKLPGTVGVHDHMNSESAVSFALDLVQLAKTVIANNQELPLLMALTERLQYGAGFDLPWPAQLRREFGQEFTSQGVALQQVVFLPLEWTGFICLSASEIIHAIVEQLREGVHRFVSALIQNGSPYAERLTAVMVNIYSK